MHTHIYVTLAPIFLTAESFRTFIIQPKERSIFFWKLFSICSYMYSFSCRSSGKVILLNLKQRRNSPLILLLQRIGIVFIQMPIAALHFLVYLGFFVIIIIIF